MKIIQGTNAPKPFTEAQSAPAAAPEMGRLDALEKIAKSILQKLQILEARVNAVEKIPSEPTPSQEPVQPPLHTPPPMPSTSTLDVDAVKKGLLTNMWKYLNDTRPSKVA